MYSELPADIRHQHPYHMYDEIKAQPEAVARSFAVFERQGEPGSRVVGQARRVYLTGCGTSWHAAQIGAWMLRAFTRGGLDVHAVQAFEMATYEQGIRPGDVLIAVTHSGVTAMALRALDKGRAAGATGVAVTGFPESAVRDHADVVLPTGYNDERSWAHTASYTAALATLAALANSLASSEERLDLSPLPEVLHTALELEEVAHRLAASAVSALRTNPGLAIMLVGGGPNALTAQEGALKLLETSYVQATGWELEQVLHGPLAALTPGELCIIIAPSGASVERAVQLMHAVQRIEVTPVVITDDAVLGWFDGAHRLVLPEVPEILSPFSTVVPLQLFSYVLALGNGFNPDLIHRDDERYRLAAAEY